MKHSKPHKALTLWRHLPLAGSVLFLLLYFIAALYYPGGTYLNKASVGFSWTQNYWCNLLSENAINGQPNAARPIAFMAMIVLCLALIMFWYRFPLIIGFKARERYLVQASGFISMVISAFIFTNLHDILINVAGLFGLIALAGTLVGLRRSGLTTLFYMGIVVVVLVGVNNFLYYQKDPMHYLAVVQKITFLFFLLWICLVHIRCMGKQSQTQAL